MISNVVDWTLGESEDKFSPPDRCELPGQVFFWYSHLCAHTNVCQPFYTGDHYVSLTYINRQDVSYDTG